MNILLVEDEPALRSGLTDLLEGAGHKVEAVGDGLTACGVGLTSDVNLVLLDLTLPDLDGLEVCRRLRNGRPELLIMMLTARSNEDDKVKGLKLGADDYVTKPFRPRVLVARVRNLLRRPRLESAGNELLRAGAIEVDVGRHEVRVDGAEVSLTHTEFEILRALMSAPGRVRTRGDILSRLDQGQHVLERTVDVHVASLRKKLGAAGELISTVRGVGYRLRD